MTVRPMLVVSAAAALVIPSFAVAGTTKRPDRDGMPTKWELRYHLNPKVNDAAKDKDRDGLDNLGEYQSGTNPRKADSDRDGVSDSREDSDDDGIENDVEVEHGLNPGRGDSDRDGVKDRAEVAGTIASFDGTTLVITLLRGSSISGIVGAATDIECETPVATAARLDRGRGEDRGGESDDDVARPTSPASTPTDSAPATTPSRGDDDDRSGDDDERDQEHGTCTPAALVTGAPVHEAKLKNGIFTKVELSD